MRLAILWTGGPEPPEPGRRALEQAGRYAAAGGHALLLHPPEGPSRLAGESYRAAGGRDLASLPREAPPEAAASRADILLFLGPPLAALLAAAREAGKPAYALAPLAGPSAGAEGLRILPGMEAFARELARLVSRAIVSRPDPMGRRPRGPRHNS